MSGKSEKGYRILDFSADKYSAVIDVWTATGLAQAWRKDDLETILRTLANGAKLKLLLDPSDRVIGTSWITHDYRRSWIHHFAIHPDFQGNGYSHLLMISTIQVIEELGYQAKLEVHHNNEKAVRLYEKGGFRELEGYMVYMKR